MDVYIRIGGKPIKIGEWFIGAWVSGGAQFEFHDDDWVATDIGKYEETIEKTTDGRTEAGIDIVCRQ
jgi:hypothetical protein